MTPGKIPADCMPQCGTCNCGHFKAGEVLGECHLLPMDWVVVNDSPTPMWKPAYKDKHCRHYMRKVN